MNQTSIRKRSYRSGLDIKQDESSYQQSDATIIERIADSHQQSGMDSSSVTIALDKKQNAPQIIITPLGLFSGKS